MFNLPFIFCDKGLCIKGFDDLVYVFEPLLSL